MLCITFEQRMTYPQGRCFSKSCYGFVRDKPALCTHGYLFVKALIAFNKRDLYTGTREAYLLRLI